MRLAVNACMVDGFGVFEEADYRRSWLFFQDVDYILPAKIAGPMSMPDGLERSLQFRLARPELPRETTRELIDLAKRDCGDAELRTLVGQEIPRGDLDYAALLVFSDPSVRAEATPASLGDPVFAISFLLHKLLLFAAATGAVPIVGKKYAAALIAKKLSGHAARDGSRSVMKQEERVTFAALAAGLSLDFVADEELSATPFERLVEFKQKNSSLLEKHQLHLIEVAEEFAGLPDGSGFDDRLRRLRTEALRKRVELDEAAKEAWLAMGQKLLKKAVAAGSAGFFSGLAILRGYSLHDIVTAAAPAAVSAVGAATLGAVDAISKLRKQRRGDLAYLFRAEEAMSR